MIVICYNCQGQKRVFTRDEMMVTCPTCKGRGKIDSHYQLDLFVKPKSDILEQYDVTTNKN